MLNILPAADKKADTPSRSKEKPSFPIVAIGASSGGLEAVTELLKSLPADTGMAFIFIQHLSPDHKSLLVPLLSKSTKMAVQEIGDMDLMKPNNIYVVPYNKGIEVTDGHIQLISRAPKGVAMTIDVLFTSLAETHREDAIGVILSGNASDGTAGLRAIKEHGGVTFAQDRSAKYGSMPESAISEGVADFVLSPAEIAEELDLISKHASKRKKNGNDGHENSLANNDPDLISILQLLHKETGVDFSHYKMNTVKRRILRRVFFHKLNNCGQYARQLKGNAEELALLYNDLLINFTDFFRDPEAFQHFKTTLFPQLLKSKAQNETLRIWVAACSAGQEAYSIAMLLIEILGDRLQGKQVQIFATDLSEKAIKKARTGLYTRQEVKDISPQRLERFFTLVNGNYLIDKSVRNLCSFAPHNILSNPPFSRIDFVSCCNFLIYLDNFMQNKVLATFHYSLNDNGFLSLGKSEAISSAKMFTQPDRNFKVYLRKEGGRRLPELLSYIPLNTMARKEKQPDVKNAQTDIIPADIAINEILFTRYMPAYVVINSDMVISRFKGNTANYLQHGTGKATLNILNMARPEIAFELMDAINKAMEAKQEVHKTGIEIKNDDLITSHSIDVIPIKGEDDAQFLLVVFTEQKQTEAEPGDLLPETGNSKTKNNSIRKLKEEIAVVRAQLVSVTEEKDKANRVLQSAKEEILSSNEEFQCMNEELETSKEEIESANEELITTNQELNMRNEQLTEANDFSEAIVTTLHEPMLILDKDLRVKSANKAFYKTFLVQQPDTEGILLYQLGDKEWDIPALRLLLDGIIQKETFFYDFEITHTFPHIGKRTMLLNARRIVQKAPHEQLILLAFTDVTEKTRKGKEERQGLEDIISERTTQLEHSFTALKDKNISLERSNKELETFSFISSHDLQEPLRKIRNFAACLLDEEQARLSVNGKDYLKRMQDTVKRMQLLIEDLLAYSRVKNAVINFERTVLKAIIQDVITDFKERLAEKGASVKVTGACETDIIRFQFRQLIFNLVGNSLKFAMAGRATKITIKCATIKGSESGNKDLLPDLNYAHIIYADNGIGFDPQYTDRIFEVFQRLHEYDEYKGTGIGLAICKRIIENHSGIITATGVLNKGARFDIYIPERPDLIAL